MAFTRDGDENSHPTTLTTKNNFNVSGSTRQVEPQNSCMTNADVIFNASSFRGFALRFDKSPNVDARRRGLRIELVKSHLPVLRAAYGSTIFTPAYSEFIDEQINFEGRETERSPRFSTKRIEEKRRVLFASRAESQV
ncbi:hypothetical protein PUN28_018476 [Cardiocondyla obscurior]|uniref:Uncharacterized protein n=1 Tax=Cardiocondyla obscurior TaxID=286306 RepID=A0AAW2EHU9_9HYME